MGAGAASEAEEGFCFDDESWLERQTYGGEDEDDENVISIKKDHDFDPGHQVKSSGAQFERSWGSWSLATHWAKRSQGVYLKRDDGSENDDDIDDVGDHDGGNGDEKYFWISELMCPLILAVSSTISNFDADVSRWCQSPL